MKYTHKRLITAFILVIALTQYQCSTLFKAAFDPPKVSIENVEFIDIDLAGVKLKINIIIDNPNVIGITLNKLKYKLNIEGEDLVKGVKNEPISIEGHNKNKISLPLEVRYSGLKSGITGILVKDKLHYIFDGVVEVDTPIGALSFDINKSGDIPIPARPRFSVEDVSIKEMGLTSATLLFKIAISNNQDVRFQLEKFTYDIQINSFNVSKGRIKIYKSLAKGKNLKLEIPVNLKLLELKRSMIDVIRKGNFQYGFQLKIDLNSNYGPYKLDYDKEGKVSLY